MWPVRVSNPGPPTYESGALPSALQPSSFNIFYGISTECLTQLHLTDKIKVMHSEVRKCTCYVYAEYQPKIESDNQL